MADEALAGTPSIQNVVVVQRQAGAPIPVDIQEGRDHWYHRLVQHAPAACEPEAMNAEDMLYILYTSGTTGKPKGIVHTTGGYLVGTYATTKWVFDLKEEDVYWCTADIGWVTGHSYVVYGPLANGATVMMYEGAPDWPSKDRFWEIIACHGVSILYTAPTAIRAFMRWGTEWPARHDLSSLRLLGSVGEPINPEAWMWYQEHIGRGRCPIVDTWWQTETGAIMISPLPGLTSTKPGSATRPFPGIAAEIRDASGKRVETGGGLLTITRPWPAMLRGIYGDPERFVQAYWSRWNDGTYFTGDGARRDQDGFYWLLGRVDDVLNVAGHRLGTMEVESALVDHPMVAEAAVVGKPHEIKGQSIAAFVTVKEGVKATDALAQELKEHVTQKIGAIARPEQILFAADLPKTRSGKIMRRLLRDIAEGKALGDTTTLADPAVVSKLKAEYEEKEV
jgi:acetyl-CoA synthetase